MIFLFFIFKFFFFFAITCGVGDLRWFLV